MTKIPSSPSIKNISTLVTGTSISQIIPFIIAPVVARLYEPTDYAVLAAYTSITVVLTVIATGMYDSAMMLDKSDNEALNTGVVSILITISISLIASIILIVFREKIAGFTGNEQVSMWIFLVPFTILFHGFYQVLSVWNNRKKQYKRLAGNRIIQTIVTSSLMVSFGFLHMHEKGLLISMISGQAISFGILFSQTANKESHLLDNISRQAIFASMKRHIDFPKYNMPSGLLEGFYESGILLIISNFFGAFALGSYSFTKRILMKPLQIFGTSIGQVFFQQASAEFNTKKSIIDITKKFFLGLVIIGLPFFLIITIWGESIFAFLFSEIWANAGEMAQLLSVQLFFVFLTSPISSIPIILKKQKPFLLYNIASKGSVLLGFYLCATFRLSMMQSLAVFVAIRVLFSIYLLIWYKRMLK